MQFFILLAAVYCYGGGDFGNEALEDFAGAEFGEVGCAVGYHVLDGLSPAYGTGELSHEVGFDFGGVGVGECVHVLEDGADGGVECGVFDGLCEFGACGFHAGGVEGAANFEAECAFGACGFEGFACCVHCGYFAGDDELSGAVVVGAHDGAVDCGADFFYFFVGEGEHGGHCGLGEFAGFLHGVGTGCYEAEAVFEAESAGGYECGEFAQRVSGYHVGFEFVAHGFSQEYGVDEDSGLSYSCFAEVFVGAFKHEVGDAEAEDVVSFFEEFAGFGVVFVEVFAHSYELSALTGKYECVHMIGFIK